MEIGDSGLKFWELKPKPGPNEVTFTELHRFLGIKSYQLHAHFKALGITIGMYERKTAYRHYVGKQKRRFVTLEEAEKVIRRVRMLQGLKALKRAKAKARAESTDRREGGA